jgi:hypothetical protein
MQTGPERFFPVLRPVRTSFSLNQSATGLDWSQSGNTVLSTLAQVYHSPVVIVAGAYPGYS